MGRFLSAIACEDSWCYSLSLILSSTSFFLHPLCLSMLVPHSCVQLFFHVTTITTTLNSIELTSFSLHVKWGKQSFKHTWFEVEHIKQHHLQCIIVDSRYIIYIWSRHFSYIYYIPLLFPALIENLGSFYFSFYLFIFLIIFLYWSPWDIRSYMRNKILIRK